MIIKISNLPENIETEQDEVFLEINSAQADLLDYFKDLNIFNPDVVISEIEVECAY